GHEFVAEVDESDNRLSEIIPSIPVLTNIDNDHLEHYGSIEAIEEAALNFMSSLDARDPLSVLVGCGDDKRVRNVLSKASSATRRPVLAYGLTRNCDVCAMNVRSAGLEQVFDVLGPFGMWQDFFLPMPGIHNVVNALAAISTGWHIGIPEPV